MNKDELLYKFLNGKLTPKESLRVEALKKEDPEFAAQLVFEYDVQQATIASKEEEFAQLLQEFENESKNEVQVFRLPKKWMVAASALLLTGILLLFQPWKNQFPKVLFDNNFAPYRNVVHPINRSEGVLDDKTKAFLAYSKKDYEEAEQIFERLYKNEGTSYYLFYRANALLGLDRASEAIPLLQKYLETGAELSPKARWYLALAYLQQEKLSEAKELLNEIQHSQDYKAVEAKQLLDEL